jgi:hypothetical protein
VKSTNAPGAGSAYGRNEASAEAWLSNLPAPNTTNTIAAAQRIVVAHRTTDEWRDRPRSRAEDNSVHCGRVPTVVAARASRRAQAEVIVCVIAISARKSFGAVTGLRPRTVHARFGLCEPLLIVAGSDQA